jgi:hypothetical protein
MGSKSTAKFLTWLPRVIMNKISGKKKIGDRFTRDVANAMETDEERVARHALSTATRNTRREQSEADAAERAQEEGMANLQNWLNTEGSKEFAYDPESEAMDIYRRQAEGAVQGQRQDVARLLAQRGVGSSGALQRITQRARQAQQGLLDQSTRSELGRQYGQFTDTMQRGFQREAMKYNILQQDYDRAKNEYFQNLALKQQATMNKLSAPSAMDNFLGLASSVAPFVGAATGLPIPSFGGNNNRTYQQTNPYA